MNDTWERHESRLARDAEWEPGYWQNKSPDVIGDPEDARDEDRPGWR